jgi:predicted O-methyltransferase YrrM
VRRALWEGSQYLRDRGQDWWSSKTPLARKLLELEGQKSDRTLAELDGFPELRNSAWWGLQSLGYQMVSHYKPSVVVELGTHMGLSALAMGLALRDLKAGGRLFAVDTWKGDAHAGSYGDEVYQTFLSRLDQLGLGSVIIPLRMTFDEARAHVPTPIDLLHIDGLHDWAAVNHDFETFGPLVGPRGLILFHDVNTGFEDMRRFWRSVRHRYESHTVPYSHGLGVVRV